MLKRPLVTLLKWMTGVGAFLDLNNQKQYCNGYINEGYAINIDLQHAGN